MKRDSNFFFAFFFDFSEKICLKINKGKKNFFIASGRVLRLIHVRMRNKKNKIKLE